MFGNCNLSFLSSLWSKSKCSFKRSDNVGANHYIYVAMKRLPHIFCRSVMETIGAVATATLLLLQLGICCHGSQSFNQSQSSSDQPTPPPLCNDTCYIYPDNFHYLQQMIRSDTLVILKGAIFTVHEEYNFPVVENVSNLTISGGESGSIIECSPQSTFGLHLRNATNVTLTGLTIRRCGSTIPSHLLDYIVQRSAIYDMSSPPLATSLLIEASINVSLSRICIENSPVVALTVIAFPTDMNSKDPFFTTENVANPHLTLTDCTISNSRETSMMINKPTSPLIELTNNS